MTKRPSLLVVTGPDGAGKSTLCRNLIARLEQEGLKVREVSIWDGLAEVDGLSFRSKADVMRYLGSLGPGESIARVYFLFHAMAVALERALRPSVGADLLLVNGYWYKYAVSELGYGMDWEKIRAIAAAFPVPDWVFYLSVSPQSAAGRKDSVSAYESGSSQDFVEFQRTLRRYWERLRNDLASDARWIEVSGEQSEAAVLEQVARKIGEVLPR